MARNDSQPAPTLMAAVRVSMAVVRVARVMAAVVVVCLIGMMLLPAVSDLPGLITLKQPEDESDPCR